MPCRFASIIVTYRCNARCHMCNTWQFPSKREEEISPDILDRLPFVHTINVTGGEPFIRDDLEEIIRILKKKSKRIVISSNGYFTDRVIKLFSVYPDIGIRISIEGLPKSNDELRGIKDGFDHGLRTLIKLHGLGIKDLGFGITLSDSNIKDVRELYHLSKMLGIEFATAAVHNAFYFHKFDNIFTNPDEAIIELEVLINELLKSNKVKDWFRAYFNFGLINYIRGKPRLLPCEMGYDSFFLDPYGEIYPCNVMESSMGNLLEKPFVEIWKGDKAQGIRQRVKGCTNRCWMMGSVGQQMKKIFWIPIRWVIKQKLLKQGMKM